MKNKVYNVIRRSWKKYVMNNIKYVICVLIKRMYVDFGNDKNLKCYAKYLISPESLDLGLFLSAIHMPRNTGGE